MTIKTILLVAAALATTLLIGCAQLGSSMSAGSTWLTGYAVSVQPLALADVKILDVNGQTLSTQTDRKGRYKVDISALTPPLLVNVTEAGYPNISDNSKPRGRSVAALMATVESGQTNIANLNPITDKVVSDVATSLSLRGPVSLILQGSTTGVTAAVINEKTAENRVLIEQALADAGVKSVETFDPVTTPMTKPVFRVYELIRHNRSYHTKSGEISDTMLFDNLFRPLSPADALDYQTGLANKAKLEDKNTIRVFMAGDSTVSNYHSEVTPRAGWGQLFQDQFKADANVLVVNAAISGRSSRSYINEGWLRMYEDLIQPNDYLFIEFGHNDEKCGSNPVKARDVFDHANTCTYANDANGQVQGADDMSFQRWLEKYVVAAESKGATPVVLTPITRIVRAKDKKTGVFPIESSTHIVYRKKSSGEFVGDYAQTARDTAKAHDLVLIDLDSKTMAFANQIGEPAWKDYWLAVDAADYPYYKEGKTGNINKPDATHLQVKGAVQVSTFVMEQIKEEASLVELAKLFK